MHRVTGGKPGTIRSRSARPESGLDERDSKFREASATLQRDLDLNLETEYETTLDEDDVGKFGLKGEPVQIVSVVKGEEKDTYKLEEDRLRSILMHKKAIGKPVVLVSVAGDLRKGKSFLLNFILRYLNNVVVKGYDSKDTQWLGAANEKLQGFPWRAGTKPETTGLVMWSEPFIMALPAHGGRKKEVAVFVMDTQGAFDDESTMANVAVVFALSVLVSSVQIYNQMRQLQENDLAQISAFTEYGRIVMESNNTKAKPFQRLIFMIRDWPAPFEYSFGWEGGNRYLASIFDKKRVKEEIQKIRDQIGQCFEKTECFLMPHPGMKTSTGVNEKGQMFEGQLSDISPEFLDAIGQFVPGLFDEATMTIKKVAGVPVTGEDLLAYLKIYVEIFSSSKLPEPKNIFEATAETNNLLAVNSAKKVFQDRMEELCGGYQPYVERTKWQREAVKILKESVSVYESLPKIGGEGFAEKYRRKLIDDLREMADRYRRQNLNKNPFYLWGTPMVNAGCWVGFTILSEIFGLFRITYARDLCSTIAYSFLIFGIVYITLRFSNSSPSIVRQIDNVIEVIAGSVLKPLLRNIFKQAGVGQHSSRRHRSRVRNGEHNQLPASQTFSDINSFETSSED